MCSLVFWMIVFKMQVNGRFLSRTTHFPVPWTKVFRLHSRQLCTPTYGYTFTKDTIHVVILKRNCCCKLFLANTTMAIVSVNQLHWASCLMLFFRWYPRDFLASLKMSRNPVNGTTWSSDWLVYSSSDYYVIYKFEIRLKEMYVRLCANDI